MWSDLRVLDNVEESRVLTVEENLDKERIMISQKRIDPL